MVSDIFWLFIVAVSCGCLISNLVVAVNVKQWKWREPVRKVRRKNLSIKYMIRHFYTVETQHSLWLFSLHLFLFNALVIWWGLTTKVITRMLQKNHRIDTSSDRGRLHIINVTNPHCLYLLYLNHFLWCHLWQKDM